MQTIQKYLANYAEPETVALENQSLHHPAEHCVVIPARDEHLDFLRRFIQTYYPQHQAILLILIINQPPAPTSSAANQLLFEYARTAFDTTYWQQDNVELRGLDHLQLILVDRSQNQPVPPHQGVGLARKIGVDLACKLYLEQKILSPWVHSSDADANLPANYFHASTQHSASQNSALVFDFTHCDFKRSNINTSCIEATQLYEQALRYYRKGLRYANSPYAFYTLGSTLCVSAQHYCQARGFPRRAGGEDFYLLNKLAKLGMVKSIDDLKIPLQIRNSSRVPFGTGPAVAKIQLLENATRDYHYYNADIFNRLAIWLKSVNNLWIAINTNEPPLANLPADIRDAVIQLGVEKFLGHARLHCKSLSAFIRQFHQWFDAFQTLKFIHFLQDKSLPPQPLQAAAQQLEALINDRHG